MNINNQSSDPAGDLDNASQVSAAGSNASSVMTPRTIAKSEHALSEISKAISNNTASDDFKAAFDFWETFSRAAAKCETNKDKESVMKLSRKKLISVYEADQQLKKYEETSRQIIAMYDRVESVPAMSKSAEQATCRVPGLISVSASTTPDRQASSRLVVDIIPTQSKQQDERSSTAPIEADRSPEVDFASVMIASGTSQAIPYVSVAERVAAIEHRSSIATRTQQPGSRNTTQSESCIVRDKEQATRDQLMVEEGSSAAISITSTSSSTNTTTEGVFVDNISLVDSPIRTSQHQLSLKTTSSSSKAASSPERADIQPAVVVVLLTIPSVLDTVDQERVAAHESEGAISAGSSDETAGDQHVDAAIADAIGRARRRSRANTTKNAAAAVSRAATFDADLGLATHKRFVSVVSSSRMWDPGGIYSTAWRQ